MENTTAILDFPVAKTAPSNVGPLKNYPSKSSRFSLISGHYGFFNLGGAYRFFPLIRVLINNETKLRLISNIYSVLNKLL